MLRICLIRSGPLDHTKFVVVPFFIQFFAMHHSMEDSYDPVFGLDSRISDEQVISTLPHDIG